MPPETTRLCKFASGVKNEYIGNNMYYYEMLYDLLETPLHTNSTQRGLKTR